MVASAHSIQPWNSSLPTLTHLQNCKTQRDINQLHARIITTGFIKNPYLTTKLILNFSTSPHQPLVNFSHYILCSQKQTHLWNILIKSLSHGNNPKQAILLFISMLSQGVYVDKFTYSLILKACSRICLVNEGLQVQGLIVKSGLMRFNVFLQNSMINLYLKCGCVESARMVFDRMPVRDSVSWNLMINGYAKNGMLQLAKEVFHEMPNDLKNLRSWNSMITGYVQAENGIAFAWELFCGMPKRDLVSWNVMIDGFVKCGKIEVASKLFGMMPEKDAVSWATMIDGYVKIGRVEEAKCLFDEMPEQERDVITWNALMSGYVQNGFYAEAIKLFREMALDESSRLVPDDTTLVVTLSAIAELGYIGEGEQIHKYVVENDMRLDGILGVALIDMYSKCGNIETAMLVFMNLDEKSVDHWNAIIGGLAVNGLGELALDLFMEMERLSVKPDDITFIGVLNACNHAGMVNEGVMLFEHMKKAHHTKPKLQHYGCMVDILGRAGFLDEAMKLIEVMPFKPNDMVWRALLSACKNHEKYDVGIRLATHILESGFHSSSACVLLSNLYAASEMWSDVSRVRSMMKEKDIKKVPGRSWIELEGTVHEFVVGDKSHPEAQEIYSVLDKLNYFIL